MKQMKISTRTTAPNQLSRRKPRKERKIKMIATWKTHQTFTSGRKFFPLLPATESYKPFTIHAGTYNHKISTNFHLHSIVNPAMFNVIF